jgi:phosphohistidine phosphatase
MLTLSILRHAKAAPANSEQDDYERPLTKGGAKDAANIGTYLRTKKLRPDLVLCSGATRTRATLERVLAELGEPAPEVRYERALYHPSPAALLKTLQNVAAAPQHVMIVGHNPELHALCVELIGQGNTKDVSALTSKLPKSALAIIELDVADWQEVRAGSGRLARFITP